jgi:serine/threonine-protein kinase HipA
MSGRTAQVFLDRLVVGSLIEDERGFIECRLSPEYRAMPSRPVLGQWFEDHLASPQRSERAGELPSFFANLIPEGDLRLTLEERLGIRPGDDLGLLCAVGNDLPGAVVVQAYEGIAPESIKDPLLEVDDAGLRFSLAGVQLKFSLVRHGGRFAMPGRDGRGDWIAKIAMEAYTDLCANEWVTMEWARMLGFDVPATELRTLSDLINVPYDANPATAVFMVQRFDRGPGRLRIHQEDFQQIVGRKPRGKYSDATYELLALLTIKIVGEEVWPEMLRRLTFMVASGNDDAHLKNWSVIYPNGGVRAQLSPLYDQVFTAQWPDFTKTLALKLGGAKDFASIDMARFRELAKRVGQRPQAAEQVVEQTVAEAAAAWERLREHPTVTDGYREALQRHWLKVPLLRAYAAAI